MIGTVELLFWYFLAIAFGTLAKEFWYLKNNQQKYITKDGIDSQISNWWKDRWDDTLFSFFFGGVAAFIFHTVDIDHLLEQYADGFLGVTSEALAALFAMFSDTIMKRFAKGAEEIDITKK
jgi:hypothetical protein